MEYYSAVGRKDILPSATTWIELEQIMLSETSERQRQVLWSHLYVELRSQMCKSKKYKNQAFTYTCSLNQHVHGKDTFMFLMSHFYMEKFCAVVEKLVELQESFLAAEIIQNLMLDFQQVYFFCGKQLGWVMFMMCLGQHLSFFFFNCSPLFPTKKKGLYDHLLIGGQIDMLVEII